MNKLVSKLCGGNVSLFTKLKYAYYKGAGTLLRGTIKLLFLKSAKFPFFLGKNVKIQFPEKLQIGKSVYFGDFCYFNCLSKGGVTIGDNVTIREFGWLQLSSNLKNLGESIEIGCNTYIGPRVVLGAAGKLVIGEKCQIGAGVNFIAENHSYDDDSDIFDQGVIRKGITIGNNCWIGNNVIILDGVVLGDNCVVGAGSVLTKPFDCNSVIIGNKAKLLKKRHD